jgi:hypothetical protein
MRTFQISEPTITAALRYLAGCPYAQVEQIVQALKNEIGAAMAAEKEKPEPEKAEVKVDKER